MTQQVVRLTNGEQTFTLSALTEDENGPVHGVDKWGSGYTRCDGYACEHEHAPTGATVWHDDEHTEELWAA